jgi:hypothetical protein
MSQLINLSEKEMAYMEDVDFLLTRRKINRKINRLLLQCEADIKHYLKVKDIAFPDGVKFRAGKIAKGENYLKLPYYMLDFPRQFSQDSIFAMRTMFWWGHYFCVTLHLSGEALDAYRESIMRNLCSLKQTDLYVYHHPSDPWLHHVAKDTYRKLDDWDESQLQQHLAEVEHLKLCEVLPLNKWNHLPAFTIDFLRKMLSLVSLLPRKH